MSTWMLLLTFKILDFTSDFNSFFAQIIIPRVLLDLNFGAKSSRNYSYDISFIRIIDVMLWEQIDMITVIEKKNSSAATMKLF